MNKRSIGSIIFDTANAIILLAMGIGAIIPFIYVVAASLTPQEELIKYSFILYPRKLTFDAYKYVFSTNTIPKALMVSVFVTLVGTLLNLGATSLMAYPLAHTRIYGHKIFMLMVTVTLVFGGGMIPSYMLIKNLGLMDTYAAVLVPGAIGAFELILFKNFFQQIPAELEESAKIDGCNDLRILFTIILPLSKPLLATFGVMSAVGNWNAWFNYILYISDPKKWPVQVVLQMMVSSANAQIGDTAINQDYVPPQEIIKMCVIVIVTLPIMIVYPFLQKYFTKGMLVGSVKG